MIEMSGLVYGLCALTALVCAWLLLQAWWRSRYRLLLWSGLCFIGLTFNNLLLVFDKLIFPEIDLSLWRYATAMVSLVVLLFGMIWETK
jgi:hypothetical protein